MTDPKGTFYYEGELPAHHSFGATDGVEEFELKPKFTLTNPEHVREAELMVAQGILSKTAPRKD